jgi:hypothetical protein
LNQRSSKLPQIYSLFLLAPWVPRRNICLRAGSNCHWVSPPVLIRLPRPIGLRRRTKVVRAGLEPACPYLLGTWPSTRRGYQLHHRTISMCPPGHDPGSPAYRAGILNRLKYGHLQPARVLIPARKILEIFFAPGAQARIS